MRFKASEAESDHPHKQAPERAIVSLESCEVESFVELTFIGGLQWQFVPVDDLHTLHKRSCLSFPSLLSVLFVVRCGRTKIKKSYRVLKIPKPLAIT